MGAEMFDWIYDLSTQKIVIVFCAFFIGFAWMGTVFVRPIIRLFVRGQPGLNDILSSFLSMYGVLFGILLGLIAAGAFEDRQEVDQSITSEATAVFALFHTVSSYPPSESTELEAAIGDYLKFVIETEWPALRKGVATPTIDGSILELKQRLISFEPKTAGQEALHGEGISQFFSFLELRNQRLYNATDGIPDIVWYLVILGALLNISILWLFEVRLSVQFVLGGILGLSLALEIALIAILDKPLRGDAGLSPEVFEHLYQLVTTSLAQ